MRLLNKSIELSMNKKTSVGASAPAQSAPVLNQQFQLPNQEMNSDIRMGPFPQMESSQIFAKNKLLHPSKNFNQNQEGLGHLKFQAEGNEGRFRLDHFPEQEELQNRKQPISRKSQKFKDKRLNVLSDLIFKQKVSRLKCNFIQKLKRNNTYAPPIESQEIKEHQPNYGFLEAKGIQIDENLACYLNILFVVNIILTGFIQSMCLVFEEVIDSKAIRILQTFSICVYLLQIVFKLITVRVTLGRKLYTLRQISEDYLRQSFYIDVINVTIIILNFVTSSSVLVLNILKIFILLKFPEWFGRIKNLEVQFIESYNKKQFWSLIKVFLLNFIFAHILSIVLLSMANLNSKQNWLLKKGLTNSLWFQKYVWSYYWSTSIMLTIGFGDLTPKCYQQALVMIFVEVFSIVILAYNIKCLGTIITNIRALDQEMHKNLNVFKKLAKKNLVSEDLSWKINNFIHENSKIKKLTNFQEQTAFVENLPPSYKRQYLKESNRHIFNRIYFFSSIMEKTLCVLSEKLKAKIAHPLEVILNNQSNFDLLILKKGEIGCKSNKSLFLSFPNLLLNKVKVGDRDNPFLLHTNFITKENSPYKILSTVHSLLYYLDYESLTETLRSCSIDFELYCQLRDKSKYYLDEFQVFICKNCRSRHSDFNCPKYHFIPFKEHVVHKQILLQSKKKNQRANFQRNKPIYFQKFVIFQNSKKQSELWHNHKSNRLAAQRRQKLFKILQQRKNSNQIQLIEGKSNILQKLLYDTVSEAISNQIMNLLQSNQGSDSVWLINTDKMQDFRNYFPKNNPSQLEISFKKQQRFEPIEGIQFDLNLSEQPKKKRPSPDKKQV